MTDNRNLNFWYKYALENIQDIIWELDVDLNFIFVSPNSKTMSGYESDEMIGRSMLDFLTPESKQNIITQWMTAKAERSDGNSRIVLYDVQFVCKNGRIIWYEVSVKPVFDEGKFIGYIGTSRDISEKKAHEIEIKKYIQELEYTNKKLDNLTTFDLLTGAYSRRKFEEFASLPAGEKVNGKERFSIIMFDIDFFKQINDQHGHKTGDYVLQEVSLIVRSVLRDTDKLFRWGGDEFIVLLMNSPLKDACDMAEIIRKAVELHDFGFEDKDITISLGVGEYLPGDNVDQLLSNVDKAMLKAKNDGKNRIEASMLSCVSFRSIGSKLAN